MGSLKGTKPAADPGDTPGTSGRPEISERVLAYFRRNSEAMDSVEGIARFWVREDRSVVERALAGLHESGLLDRRILGGTAFYSLRKDAAAPRPAPRRVPSNRSSDPSGRPAPERETPGRLLVIDDDASVRKFLVAALTEAGHSVAAAEDGERGVDIFRTHPCDLVLTDIRMPGMSGIQVLKTIKQVSPSTEVIVVTAHASIDTAIQALRDGAYDLITKPLPEIDTLYRVVDRALERRRLGQENRLLVDSLQARNVELTETVARLAAVNEIGKATAGLLDSGDLYDSLVRLVAQHLRARRVSVLVSEPDSDTLALVASVGIPDQEGVKRQVRLGEGISGRVAATQAPLLVADIEKTELKEMRTGGKYSTTSFMITPLTVSYPIRYQHKWIGVINVSDKHSGEPFNEQDLEFLSTLASQMAVAIENARLVKELEDGYLGALVSLIRSAEDARPETRGHSEKVANLAASLARALDVPESRIDVLVRAAALHEVGRLSTPGLREAGGPARGDVAPGWTSACVMATERILAPIASLRPAREIILRSADWFDAAPAPFGGDRPSVPVETRILAVCEDYVRLSSGGCGLEGRQQALDRLRTLSGRKHDPEVVEALCRLIEKESDRDGGRA